MYKCPICGDKLLLNSKSLICPQNHTFDVAKENYVNLLAVQDKKSKDPGDNKEMIQSRRNFLEKNFYKKFHEQINSKINEISLSHNIETILDVGCGEGYYTGNLKIQKNINLFGLDISKYGIILAAKKYKNIRFCVGSTYKLPFFDNSVDILISIFAPLSYDEFQRVLKPKGKIIVAGPGKEHLKELAGLIYEKVNEHEGNRIPFKDKDDFKEIETSAINYKINLGKNDDIMNLLKMTPYFWSTKEQNLENISKLENLNVTADFEIRIFQKI